MVSDVGAGKMEGWVHSIDNASELEVCEEDGIPQEELPVVLHYCEFP